MLQILQRSETRSGTAYIDRGHGGEAVVLIHGVGMRSEAWAPQIDRLAENFRVIAVDLPGHGDTPQLRAPAQLPDFVRWFDRTLGELEAGPVNVAGHSMGALIATGMAATAAEKVRRVALLNGVYRRSHAARQAVKARADEIISGAFDRAAPLARWFSEGERDSTAYALAHALLDVVDPSGYATAYRAFASGDSIYSDCWSRVTCPALFLTGDGDLNSTAEMARQMAAATPRGEAVVIKGHRHMVNLTAPKAVNEALIRWLGREVENDV
jgi:pimeloyl-ACP methyl ester carboxylesterase